MESAGIPPALRRKIMPVRSITGAHPYFHFGQADPNYNPFSGSPSDGIGGEKRLLRMVTIIDGKTRIFDQAK